MAEEPSLPYYLPIAGGRIIEFIPFPRVLVQCEMQSVSSRIWTRVAVSISYDDNHYTTGTSITVIVIRNGIDDTTKLFTFHFALMPLGNIWFHLFYQLWVNSRVDWVFQSWNLSCRRRTLNSVIVPSVFLPNFFWTISCAPIIIGITVTLIFHDFLVHW